MKKKILIVEPFFSGSHASWLRQYVERSAHDIELLTMDGRFWKWRMYGGAYTMADAFMALDYVPDVILTTDMMDLSTFVALIRKKLQPTTQIKVYFHENQFAYPWKESAEDVKFKRDVHYGFTNYSTAAVADQVLFNSAYNMNSFFAGLQDNLRRMPDYRHDHAVEDLRKKSIILPIGIPLKKIHASCQVPYYGKDPLILWNHRWEHDKNPKDFFDALRAIKAEGYPFKLALLGDRYHRCPKEFEAGLRDFENEIIKTGLLKGDEYASWLRASDIIPITSNHDFFGISIMEAVYAGSYPILPNRLTYPDLYKINDHPDLFYETQQELVDKLKYAIKHIHTIRKVTYNHLAQPYDWENLIQIYDDTIGN